jgi:lambda family phage portal protein
MMDARQLELLPKEPGKKRGRPKAIQPGMKKMGAAFTSSDRSSRELAGWKPSLQSADSDMLPEKEMTEARAIDLVRNNGYAAGAVQGVKDRVVGNRFKLVLNPEHRAFNVDRQVMRDWARMVEGSFHAWADDSSCSIDAQRKRTFTEILRDAEATKFIQGEAFISREFRFQPFNQSPYGTCFLMIEPERISQPNGADVNKIRSGIEFDSYGAATAYHVRTRHPADYQNGYNGVSEWQRITKYNRFGWLQMIHVFDQQRANQSRGFSKFAAIVQRLKMMDRHENVTLELSIIASALAVVIESQFGQQSAFEAIGASPMQSLFEYSTAQAEFRKESPLLFDGVRIPALLPGEKLNVSRAEPPGDQFAAFQESMLRHVARGLNVSYEQVSGDYSKTSYSSARAALAEAWGSVLSARESGPVKIANHIFRLWLDEAVTRGLIELPAGVDFAAYQNNKALLTRCTWIGAGRMPIDELKSAKANELMLATNQTTLASIAADYGQDYEELLQQRAEEKRLAEELGLTDPSSMQQVNQPTQSQQQVEDEEPDQEDQDEDNQDDVPASEDSV